MGWENMKYILKKVIGVVILVLIGLIMVLVNVVLLGLIEVKYIGYIKVDGIYSDYLNGEGYLFNCDFYVLLIIVVGSVDDDISGWFDVYVR